MRHPGRNQHDIPLLQTVAVIVPEILHVLTAADKQYFIKNMRMEIYLVRRVAGIVVDLCTGLHHGELLVKIFGTSLEMKQDLF